MKKLAALTFVALTAPAFGADHDYSNNKAFLRKYPDLACIDTGPLSAEEGAQWNAAKLQEQGHKKEIQVTRARCYADGRDAPQQITEKISGSEWLDRLYARLGSGPIPHGFFDGKVILSKDRGLTSFADMGLFVPKTESVEAFAQRIWAGKFFDNEKMYLKNRINLDGVDWNEKPKALTDPRMKFPAKLYCGQSLFDARRESIIIDYKYGVEDRPQGVDTDANIDWLAGKAGLLIRDEVRMVRPGLYLGRAYMHGVFGLYFVLEYAEGTGKAPSADEKDECWIGHQRQRQLGLKQSDFLNNFNRPAGG